MADRGASEIQFEIEEMRALIEDGGALSQVLSGFCHRQEQEDLLVRMAEALAGEEFLLAEAGTGVGKSLAYLIPAVFWARSTRNRVVVATRTKALQDQLIKEDLPLLQKALPFGFFYALAKGRENYLCRRKLTDLVSRGFNLQPEEQEFLRQVVVWASRTRTGDRQELHMDNELLQHWPLVACDWRSCLREQCSFQDSCFRQRMIKRAESADIVVTNHALLLTSARIGNGVLPEFKYLIIDEAHNLERQAFDHFSLTFNRAEVRDILNSLSQKQRGVQIGFLVMLQNRHPSMRARLEQAHKLVEDCRQEVDNFFKHITRGVPRTTRDNSFSLHWKEGSGPLPEEMVEVFVGLDTVMASLLGVLQEFQRDLQDSPEALEIAGLIERLTECVQGIQIIMNEALGDPEQVVWIDFWYGRAAAVSASPLRIGNLLDNSLYEHLASLIMVSATLTIAEDFAYFIERNGLEAYRGEKLATITRQSPFDYDSNCRMYVVNDLANPGHRDYERQCGDFLQEFLEKVPGRTLVLFTSRRMLLDTAAGLRPHLEEQGIRLLVQHQDGEFNTLIADLVTAERAVLMGVDTFWEGVDLKGENLTCLVMVRLPFRPPSDPLTSAWQDYYRNNGENGFYRYSLPDAVLRFKQGMGRLIRSELDWGAAVILDRRLAAPPRGKSYGQMFHRSLPERRVVEISRNEAGREVSDWFNSFA